MIHFIATVDCEHGIKYASETKLLEDPQILQMIEDSDIHKGTGQTQNPQFCEICEWVDVDHRRIVQVQMTQIREMSESSDVLNLRILQVQLLEICQTTKGRDITYQRIMQ